MANDAQDIKLNPIDQLLLDSITIGTNINDRLNKIDTNFKSILSADYLKGVAGDSMVTKEIILGENFEGFSLLTIFLNIIYGEKAAKPDNHGLAGQKVVVIHSTKDENKIVASLPFVFHDPNSQILPTNSKDYIDRSCIIYFDYKTDETTGATGGEWKSIQLFPTFYYNEEVGDFCWKINGTETQLNIRGPRGSNGSPGANVLIVKGERTEAESVFGITDIWSNQDWLNMKDSRSDNLIKELGLQEVHPAIVKIKRIEASSKTEEFDWYLCNIYRQSAEDSTQSIYQYIAYSTGQTLATALNSADGYITEIEIVNLLNNRLGKLIDDQQSPKPKDFSDEVKTWVNTNFVSNDELLNEKKEISKEIQDEITKHHQASRLQLEIENTTEAKTYYQLTDNTILYINDKSLVDTPLQNLFISLPKVPTGYNVCQCGFNIGPTGRLNNSDQVAGKYTINFLKPDKGPSDEGNIYPTEDIYLPPDMPTYSQYRREYILTGYRMNDEQTVWFISASDYKSLKSLNE